MKLLAIALALAAASSACGHSDGPMPPARTQAAPLVRSAPLEPLAPLAPLEPLEPLEPIPPLASVGFHSSLQLTDHFEKHGSEFGRISRDEYLARAQRLRDAPVGSNIVEAVRGDGVFTRFDRTTGAFIAFNRDRTIRTFFRPNDGESYFARQARR